MPVSTEDEVKKVVPSSVRIFIAKLEIAKTLDRVNNHSRIQLFNLK